MVVLLTIKKLVNSVRMLVNPLWCGKGFVLGEKSQYNVGHIQCTVEVTIKPFLLNDINIEK